MKYLKNKYYVEVKDKRYSIHPTKNVILRKGKQPQSSKTQKQFINDTKIRRKQKVIKNENN